MVQNLYCKYCSAEYPSVETLTSENCSLHPNGENNGKHEPDKTRGSINDKLFDLYSSRINDMRKIKDYDESNEGGLTGPHLMYCWEEFYNRAEYKILFVGQEGGSSKQEATDEIEAQIEGYKDFRLSSNPNFAKAAYRKPITPFWRMLWEINDTLNPDLKGEPCFLVSNVSKYSYDVEPISDDDYRFIVENFNPLAQEILITQPDIIIFVSGSNYDEWLQQQFNRKLKFQKLNENISERELALVTYENTTEDSNLNFKLPKYSFRTYHPNSLQLQKKWYYKDRIIKYIKGFNSRQFFDAMESLAKDLNMTLKCFPDQDGIGDTDSCFWLLEPKWKYLGVGFGFDACLNEFFYGICKMDLSKPIPSNISELVIKVFGNPDGTPTESWPWWKWHSHKHWTIETIGEINSGQFQKGIKDIIIDLRERVDDIKIAYNKYG